MKEKMLTEVIKKYGFEHKITIAFAKLCESDTPITRLMQIYNLIMRK